MLAVLACLFVMLVLSRLAGRFTGWSPCFRLAEALGLPQGASHPGACGGLCLPPVRLCTCFPALFSGRAVLLLAGARGALASLRLTWGSALGLGWSVLRVGFGGRLAGLGVCPLVASLSAALLVSLLAGCAPWGLAPLGCRSGPGPGWDSAGFGWHQLFVHARSVDGSVLVRTDLWH